MSIFKLFQSSFNTGVDLANTGPIFSDLADSKMGDVDLTFKMVTSRPPILISVSIGSLNKDELFLKTPIIKDYYILYI